MALNKSKQSNREYVRKRVRSPLTKHNGLNGKRHPAPKKREAAKPGQKKQDLKKKHQSLYALPDPVLVKLGTSINQSMASALCKYGIPAVDKIFEKLEQTARQHELSPEHMMDLLYSYASSGLGRIDNAKIGSIAKNMSGSIPLQVTFYENNRAYCVGINAPVDNNMTVFKKGLIRFVEKAMRCSLGGLYSDINKGEYQGITRYELALARDMGASNHDTAVEIQLDLERRLRDKGRTIRFPFSHVNIGLHIDSYKPVHDYLQEEMFVQNTGYRESADELLAQKQAAENLPGSQLQKQHAANNYHASSDPRYSRIKQAHPKWRDERINSIIEKESHTLEEAAELLSVKEHSIRNYLSQGVLERSGDITTDSIIDFLAERKRVKTKSGDKYRWVKKQE